MPPAPPLPFEPAAEELLPPPPTMGPKLKLPLIIGAILLGLLVLGGGVFAFTQRKASKPEEIAKVTPTKQLPSPTAKLVEPSLMPSIAASSGAIIGKDCGIASIEISATASATTNLSLQCFSIAAKTCNPATVTVNGSLDIGGITTSLISYTIKGMQGNKCTLGIKQHSVNHIFPSEVPEEDRKPVRDVLQKLVGAEGTCLFSKEELSNLFKNWSIGTFSTQDYENGQCSGAYFENANTSGDITF
jgi:hypothetical protein